MVFELSLREVVLFMKSTNGLWSESEEGLDTLVLELAASRPGPHTGA